MLYGLKKIEFDTKEKLPSLPEKAKTISKSEFEKIDLEMKKQNLKE